MEVGTLTLADLLTPEQVALAEPEQAPLPKPRFMPVEELVKPEPEQDGGHE